MSDREDQLLDQRHQELLTAISGVHDRLDTLNGRTRTLEVKIGVLSWAYGVAAAGMAFAWAKLTGQGQ